MVESCKRLFGFRFSQSWLKADPGVSNIFMFSCGRGVNCLHQIKIFLFRKQIFAKRKWRRWHDGGGGGEWSQSRVDSAFVSPQPERGVTKESFGSKQEKEAVKRAANIRSL